jgi:hypothetical protein
MINSISTSYAKDLLKLLKQQRGNGTSQGDSEDGTEFPASPPTPQSKSQDQAAVSAESPQSPEPQTGKLTADQERVVAQLKRIDTQVRAHEGAHQSVGGNLVGAASFSYQTGPDGRQYAVGGDVPVDMSTDGSDPQAMIAKMQQVQAAAMAPSDPSGQDYAVAAQAAQIASQAQILLAQQRSQEYQRQSAEPAQKTATAAMAYNRNSSVGSSWAIPSFTAVA